MNATSTAVPVALCPREQLPEILARASRLPGATFFHSNAWRLVLQETYGFKPLYLAAEHGAAGLLPLFEVKSWLTGRRGVSLPFTDHCAALASDPALRHDLLAQARQACLKRRWKYWEYRGGQEDWPDSTPSVSYFTHHLELAETDAAQIVRFADSTRRAIRKAEKSPLQIEVSRDEPAIADFYALVCRTRRRQGLPPQPFRFFRLIQQHVLGAGLGEVVLARLKGRPVAGAVFFRFGPLALYKFGASDDRFQELRANNLVMWRAIQHYIGAGLRRLDFGRTSLGNEGLRRFKSGWGATESTLTYVKWSNRTGFQADHDRTEGLHTRLFRALPLSCSRLIGAVAYRHVA